MDIDSRKLRDGVYICVVYNCVDKLDHLHIKFPLGPNCDLHQFLVNMGTTYMKYYESANNTLTLCVRHQISKTDVLDILFPSHQSHSEEVSDEGDKDEDFIDQLNDMIDEIDILLE